MIFNILFFFNIFFFIIALLLLVAFFTLFERKVIGSVQKRLGPVYTGFFGLFQPISDAIKLILKEVILPKVSDYNFFILAPISIFFLVSKVEFLCL